MPKPVYDPRDGFYIHFLGSPHAGHLYTRDGRHPRDWEEARDEAEEQYPGEAFEIWPVFDPQGEGTCYMSKAMADQF